MLKKSLLSFLFVVIASTTIAQDFTGQWKGQFTDNSTTFMGWGGDRCDYVLELECKGTSVTGFSYTYFNEAGKRYYTICKLKGKIEKGSQFVEVVEVERTKTNVPNNIRNCFQVHRLTFFKQGDEQTLEGSWVPAPSQEGDCGYGTTVLTRRILKRSTPLYNRSTARVNRPAPKTITRVNPVIKEKSKPSAPLVKRENTPKINLPSNTKKLPVPEPGRKPVLPEERMEGINPAGPEISFEKRNNNLIKTIEIQKEIFKVDLYDNGDIDGDTVSLIFNGKLILAQKRLGSKPISLTLNIDPKKDVNELLMYAENLGEIPPNTALMIITDGTQRHEVRIASDLEKSGSIRFVFKPKTTQ